MRSCSGSASRVSPRASAVSTPETSDDDAPMMRVRTSCPRHARSSVRDARIAEDALAAAALLSPPRNAHMEDAITPLCGGTGATEFFDCATARPLHHDGSSQAPRVRSSRFVRSPASGREAASATILIPGDHARGESRVSEFGSHGPHAGETRDAEMESRRSSRACSRRCTPSAHWRGCAEPRDLMRVAARGSRRYAGIPSSTRYRVPGTAYEVRPPGGPFSRSRLSWCAPNRAYKVQVQGTRYR